MIKTGVFTKYKFSSRGNCQMKFVNKSQSDVLDKAKGEKSVASILI